MKNKKTSSALVLFSGGLDSRIAVKLLQEQNLNIEVVMFKLPFGGGCCNDVFCAFRFCQKQGIKLHIIDCTKGKLFQEYLNLVKNPKHGTGTAMNPCKDCKIFLFKHAKKLSKKIKTDIIATGEVLGQRPMSQKKHQLKLGEEKAGLKNKILRPLSAKLLPETEHEKKKLIDREKLLSIHGRQRKEQMKLAEKYNIDYPSPGGGCLLCEPEYCKKLKDLFKHKTKHTPQEIQSLNIGRHFRNKGKIILGKNKEENNQLEILNKSLKYHITKAGKKKQPTVLYQNKKDLLLVKKLIKAYSKEPELRNSLEKYKI